MVLNECDRVYLYFALERSYLLVRGDIVRIFIVLFREQLPSIYEYPHRDEHSS